MKVKELVQKFDELYQRFEELKKERDGLGKAVEELGGKAAEEGKARARAEETAAVLSGRLADAERRAGEAETALAAGRKTETDLLARIKVLEKQKAGLQERCIELEKSKLPAAGASGSAAGKK